MTTTPERDVIAYENGMPDGTLPTQQPALRDDVVASRRDGSGVTTRTLTVAEETATVEVVREETGGTRVRVVTDQEDVTLPVELSDEQVEITRHPVNAEIDAMPQIRQEGDVTILPVVEERAVVVTRLFVTEEIHIRRIRQIRTDEVQATLRRQRAVIEPLSPDPTAGDSGTPPAR